MRSLKQVKVMLYRRTPRKINVRLLFACFSKLTFRSKLKLASCLPINCVPLHLVHIEVLLKVEKHTTNTHKIEQLRSTANRFDGDRQSGFEFRPHCHKRGVR